MGVASICNANISTQHDAAPENKPDLCSSCIQLMSYSTPRYNPSPKQLVNDTINPYTPHAFHSIMFPSQINKPFKYDAFRPPIYRTFLFAGGPVCVCVGGGLCVCVGGGGGGVQVGCSISLPQPLLYQTHTLVSFKRITHPYENITFRLSSHGISN